MVFSLFAVVFFIAFVLFVAKRPSGFRLYRTILIAADAAVIFPYTHELKNINKWSPWTTIDPKSTVAFEGVDGAVGSKMSWDGNYDVGKGSMIHIEARVNEFVAFRMDFIKPFKSTRITEFTLTSEGSDTVVTWTMHGKNSFLAKLLGLFASDESLIGYQFEIGLADLKDLAEKVSTTAN